MRFLAAAERFLARHLGWAVRAVAGFATLGADAIALMAIP